MRSRAIAPVRFVPAPRGAPGPALVLRSHNDSSGLQNDRRASAQAGARHGRRATDPVLFHSGTEWQAPLWYEQALKPVFVAQLLGQQGQTAGESRSATLAYGENARQGFGPLLLDRRI